MARIKNSSQPAGKHTKEDGLKAVKDLTEREKEQRRIYGYRPAVVLSQLTTGVDPPDPEGSPSTPSRSRQDGDCPDDSAIELDDDLHIRRKIWQKFWTLRLRCGKNLIQEYVRIFETKRLVTMTMQKAKRIEMLNANKSGSNCERSLVRKLVEDYNRLARDENQMKDLAAFRCVAEFQTFLHGMIILC